MLAAQKLRNQTTTETSISDLSGGLNLSLSPEHIADNELQEALNVEYEYANKVLKTVDGVTKLCDFAAVISGGFFDKVSGKHLIASAGKLYSLDSTYTKTELGSLTGTLPPKFHAWEDGALIATGGKLQYFNGTLTTLTGSPDTCYCVSDWYGRVIVGTDDKIILSAVGDETSWTVSTVESDAKELKVGYKDSSKITNIAFLSSDIVVFKGSRNAYRVTGANYIDWEVKPLSRNMPSLNRFSAISNTNEIYLLDTEGLQQISTTIEYGDIKGTLLSAKVEKLIRTVDASTTRMWHVYPKNQLWISLGGPMKIVLVYHYLLNCFTTRQFTGDLQDVWCDGETVYLTKNNGIYKLDSSHGKDEGQDIMWSAKCKRWLTRREWVVVRTTVSIRPKSYINGSLLLDRLRLPLPYHPRFTKVLSNKIMIYNNHTKLYDFAHKPLIEQSGTEKVHENWRKLVNNKTKFLIMPLSVRRSKRNVCRMKAIEPHLSGSGIFSLNHIIIEHMEVGG